MVAARKNPASQIDLDFGGPNSYLDYYDPKSLSTFAGFIFVCNTDTFPDLERGIFGLPDAEKKYVCAIKKGMPLFLFNYSKRCLWGVFEAASDGGLNLDPHAWEITEVRRSGKPPVSRYPAQVRVHFKFQRPPLDEKAFRPILDHIQGSKFRLQLTASQVKELLKLFSVPEREFFGDRSRKWVPSPGLGTYIPDSPRTTFKSDSDCYSECSSKGTCVGEDEWAEDDKIGKETTQMYVGHGNSEPYLSDKLSHLSLNDVPNIHYKMIDDSSGDNFLFDMAAQPKRSFFLHGSNAVPHHYQQLAGRKNIVRNSSYFPQTEIFEAGDVDQVPSRFHEDDPAVNSNAGYVMHPQSDDEEESGPYIPAEIAHLGSENMIYIPIKATQHPVQSVPKKLAGSHPASKAGPKSENHDQVVHARTQKLYRNEHPIYLQSTPYGQILSPFAAGRPGSIYDSNHMTTMFPQVFLPPYSQVGSLAYPQVNVMDQIEEAHSVMNFPHLHAGGLKTFLHNGQFPVLLVPSLIPRMPPIPPLIPVGFIEELHVNILQFARLSRPSAETQLLVEASIDSIQSCVRTVWPDADVEVFGSFATGLCLQHSDVDLAVINAPLLPSLVNMTTSQASSFLLRELGLALKASKCCDSFKVIANASVPVLKCLCRPIVKIFDPSLVVPSVAIDMTIGGMENGSYQWRKVRNGSNTSKPGQQQHTGGAAREYILGKICELPALSPLVLVLKSFLQHKGLSNVYLGGLGSFSLTLLLAYYLESVPLSGDGFSESTPDGFFTSQKAAPASCLSDFLEEFEVPASKNDGNTDYHSRYKSAEGLNCSLGEYYVRKAANIIEQVLTLWDEGGVAYLGTLLLGFLRMFGFERDLAREKIVLKGIDGTPGGIFKRDNKHIALWIDDPLRPGVNIAAGSFGMCQVQAAFREMLMSIINGQPLTAPLHCEENDCQDLSAFRQLSQLSGLLIDANDRHHDGRASF